MKEPREKELKLDLVRREDYLKLISATILGVPDSTERQVNHYFDSSDFFLAERGAMIRLRLARVLTLTFKHGRETRDGSGYFDCVELETEVPRELLEEALQRPTVLAEHASPPAAALRRRFGALPLVYHGSVRNERLEYCSLSYPLVVDRVTFPDGGEAYELEIETEDQEGARRWIEGELRSRRIAFKPQHLTKLELLLEREGVWSRKGR